MFTVRFSRQTHKFLEKQPPDVQNRIRAALLELAKDPLVKRLAATDALLRLCVLVIAAWCFRLSTRSCSSWIIAIGHRGDIYRRL